MRARDAREGNSGARDLRNTLLVAGLTVLVFGAMILTSDSGMGLLHIPTLETSLLALAAALITGTGLLALWMKVPSRPVAWTVLVAYVLIISLTVHFTGGPLTPMPALYLLVVVAASFLLERRGAVFVALLSAVCYGLILALEYSGSLSMVLIWREEFNPRERGLLLVINWLAVAVPALFTALLAGTLANRLRTTNARLSESERLRGNLTEMVVHDLRSPLTALIGGLDILRMTAAEQMPPKQRELLEGSLRSGRVLVGLVDEMLDVSRMEAGALEPNLELVELRDLVQEALGLFGPLAETEGLDVQVDLDENAGSVWCDRQLIGRVMANLLSNSIKYTPPGGRITLVARRGGDGGVAFSVSDSGVGVPPEYRERVFEKFGLADHPARGRRGTGLGLAFCRMAVEAHGGRIWLEGQAGQGSTFCFTLPDKQS